MCVVGLHGGPKVMRTLRLFFLIVLLAPLSAAAEPLAVTWLEGSLRLLRGAAVFAGAEGLRLREGDILESGPEGLVQLEAADGSVVILGPATRVLLLALPGDKRGSPLDLVLRAGWLKVQGAKEAGETRVLSPTLGISFQDAAVVMFIAKDSAAAFVERNTAKVGEVGALGGFGASASVKAGDFVSRQEGKPMVTEMRPPPAFLSGMPRAFRDSLPTRLARVKDREVAPKLEHEVAYREVEEWLKAPKNWRKDMVKRFQPRTKDAEFRGALDANMRFHPEWDRILHPEKYMPKNTASQAEHRRP